MTAISILQIAALELSDAKITNRRYLSESLSSFADGRISASVGILRAGLRHCSRPRRRLVGATIRLSLNLDATK